MAESHPDAGLGASLAPESVMDDPPSAHMSYQGLPLDAAGPSASAAAAAAAAAVAAVAPQPKKKSGFSRKPWTKAEDETLKELVNKFGPKRWATIASQLPDRIGKQCRERWTNHLRPEISKEPWRPEEDVLIFYYQKLLGNQWAEIAKYLPGRTENAIKNRFHSSLRRFQRQEKRKFGQQAVLRAMFARQGMNIGGMPGIMPPASHLALALEMQKKAAKAKPAAAKAGGGGGGKEDEGEDDGGEPGAKRARTEEKDDGGAAAANAVVAALHTATNPLASVGLGGVDTQLLTGFGDPGLMAAQQALLLNAAPRAPPPAPQPMEPSKHGGPNPPPANAEVLRAALLQAAAGGNQEVLGKLLGMSAVPTMPTIDPAIFAALQPQNPDAGGKAD
eukprot:CAMPEP_0118876332 /NCGR_PEP_ID=MMETSP1163-20130328/17066_1 /TAXON_ID=124430 /ORGANISM="Phaeomonas parva, Strain CCMP2877" /LENGTH=389 /DNA_ID=CAMNT_0006811937 /DNA_START=235 /DNA_END=1404 /DNA_ORIENTATION=-